MHEWDAFIFKMKSANWKRNMNYNIHKSEKYWKYSDYHVISYLFLRRINTPKFMIIRQLFNVKKVGKNVKYQHV